MSETGRTSACWCRRRTVLVTGAGSGMGRAVALALGQRGAHVGVHYRSNESGAAAVVAQIERAGGTAVALQGDLADPDAVNRLFEQLDKAFADPIEGLVCNAGEWMDKRPIAECPLGLWDRMFAVNVRSVFMCCQQAARRMINSGRGGSIVNIGSVAGHTGGGGGTVPYAAAKAAVHTFTRGLARELAPHGIRVNAVAPGMIETPMLQGRVSREAEERLVRSTPLGRFGKPDEIVAPVLMLLSPEASYITGGVVEVDGGLLMR